jgi:hypothetical protein
MQEVELPREADTAGAAIAELLHAGRRDPERVGVVPVEREGLSAEARLDPLDPRGARADPDRVAFARSFKTAGVGPA